MELYKVRDIVREQVPGLSEASLAWSLERGLREIEKAGNFYWMEAVKSFNLVVDQGDYSIYTSTSSGLNIPAYKDARILVYRDPDIATNSPWNEVPGPEDIEDVKPEFTDDDIGAPRVWTKKEANNDVTLQIWPPNPDKAYNMELHYYQWTSLPTDSTIDLTAGSAGHEVLKRWPEALIYCATEQAIILKTKDLQAGVFWKKLFDNAAKDTPGELQKIKRYNSERAQSSRVSIHPMRGGLQGRLRNRWSWRNYE